MFSVVSWLPILQNIPVNTLAARRKLLKPCKSLPSSPNHEISFFSVTVSKKFWRDVVPALVGNRASRLLAVGTTIQVLEATVCLHRWTKEELLVTYRGG